MPFADLPLGETLRSPWILGPAVFVLWIAAFVAAKTIVLGAMRRVAARTPWAWDDVVIGAASTPLLIAIVASGFVVLGRILPLAPEWDRAFDVVLYGALVLALVLFADRAGRGALDRLETRSPAMQGARGLVQAGLRAVIIGLGVLVFLDSIGVSITPILASLGVGSLAVALALQDTLANLFAGIYIVADKPVEPGHMVRLESGEIGSVMRVGWRNTWIRMLTNNVVVVPNVKLAGSVITNFNLPDSEMVVTVDLGVPEGSDLDRVQQVTEDVAREVARELPAAVPSHVPVARYVAIGDAGLRLSVALRARDYACGNEVRHLFIKRVIERFRREGIALAYPVRTLDLPPLRIAALPGDMMTDGPGTPGGH
jgi:small-conductance mechanosensitive channel